MGIDDGRGAEIYAKVIGDGGPSAALREVMPDIERYAVDLFYGEIYDRPPLDLKTRELISIVSLATLGTAPRQLRAHLNGALNTGWTRTEIAEALLQLLLTAGLPAAINGLVAAQEVFASRDEAGQADPRWGPPQTRRGSAG
jgi:4-carboxymuconolactone decarboxylase